MNNELIERIAQFDDLAEVKQINGLWNTLQDCKAALTQQQEAEPAFAIRSVDLDILKTYKLQCELIAVPPGRAPESWVRVYLHPPKPAALSGEAVELPEIYDAYKTWPEDIRKKLSLHDLRRMSGWKMEAAQPQVPEGCPSDIEVREAVAAFMKDTQTIQLEDCAKLLVMRVKRLLSAAKEEGKDV